VTPLALLHLAREEWAEYFDKEGISYAFYSAANAKALQEARLEAEIREEAEENRQLASDGEEELNEDEEISGRMATLTTNQHQKEPPSDPDTDENVHHYNLIKNDPKEDARTRVLTVLELEDLFVRSAPPLAGMRVIGTVTACF
jgi:large subunit GTPase 1